MYVRTVGGGDIRGYHTYTVIQPPGLEAALVLLAVRTTTLITDAAVD